MPGLSISVEGMVASLRRVVGDAAVKRIVFEREPAVERIVDSWPGNFSATYARSLGFSSDSDFDGVIRAFIAENAGVAA
ncbi:Nucleoside-diphosphate-sugar epimerase [Apophysomyces sp. BC1015]|nr:Nucleoside-diphosphate-sugar epimerase [Apophysomyces sp. BC1015]